MENEPKPSRKNIRLNNFDYSRAGYYFVTIVSHQRKHIFGEIVDGQMTLSQVGMILEESWGEIPLHFPNIDSDAHVVMPDHFHGILIITGVGARHASPGSIKNKTLGMVVGSFKSAVTKRIHDLGLSTQEKIWQRNYYEHIIQDERDYQKIYDYIENNPANWTSDEENIETQ